MIETTDEQDMINNIVISSDWEEVINNIIVEERLDPWNIDIVKLTDAFVAYLNRLKVFDFRIPARFILIAAILLRMKCELLSMKEEVPDNIEGEHIPPFDINSFPILEPPVGRTPTRPVMLNELVSALEKAFEFRERKETKRLRMRRAVEGLIEPEEDMESRVNRIYGRIVEDAKSGDTTFSRLVGEWNRKRIIDVLLPLLHLSNRGSVTCEQPEMFSEIYIKLV